MTYIGIDPSLRGTGIAIADDAGVHDLIRLSTEGISRAQALSHVAREVQYVVRQHRGCIVGIEGYALGYARNSLTGLISVVEVGGAIRAVVGLVAPWVDIAPATWWHGLVGKKRVQKKINPTEYRSIAARVTGCEHLLIASDDEADAAMIAVYLRDAHAESETGRQRDEILRERVAQFRPQNNPDD